MCTINYASSPTGDHFVYEVYSCSLAFHANTVHRHYSPIFIYTQLRTISIVAIGFSPVDRDTRIETRNFTGEQIQRDDRYTVLNTFCTFFTVQINATIVTVRIQRIAEVSHLHFVRLFQNSFTDSCVKSPRETTFNGIRLAQCNSASPQFEGTITSLIYGDVP